MEARMNNMAHGIAAGNLDRHGVSLPSLLTRQP